MRLPRIALLYFSLAVTLALCAGIYARYKSVALVLECVAVLIFSAIIVLSLFFLGVKQLARRGDYYFITKLGRLYADGRGVPRDYVKAVRWWRIAAEHGHPAAQSFLGAAYDEGNGVPKDPAEAVRWYRMAAEQGDAVAQLVLGTMYHRGSGVDKNTAEAVRWYRMAAKQGETEASPRELLHKMYSEETNVLERQD
jgi:TPR repeat protein